MNLSDKEKKKYKKRTDQIKELEEWKYTTYEYWKKRFEQFPEAVSTDLKRQVKYLDKRIGKLESEHTKVSEDPYSSNQYANDLKGLINVYTSLKGKLEKLSQGKGKSKNGPGAPVKATDDQILPYVIECIKIEAIETDTNDYSFITKTGKNVGKIKHTTIGDYLFMEVPDFKEYEDSKQLRERVLVLLPDLDITEEKEGKYFKKGNN